jgi:hypothetical protein
MEVQKVKIVAIRKTDGSLLNNLSGVNDALRVAKTMKTISGVGGKFLVFPDTPNWVPPTIVNFDLYPQYVVQENETDTAALITEMLAADLSDALA